MSEPLDHDQAVSRLAGQLDYLFDESPELQSASSSQLLDRLQSDDRHARARAEQPVERDEWVKARAGELDRRFTVEQVEEALAIVRRRRA